VGGRRAPPPPRLTPTPHPHPLSPKGRGGKGEEESFVLSLPALTFFATNLSSLESLPEPLREPPLDTFSQGGVDLSWVVGEIRNTKF
jgi:hypothetical protein